MQQAHWGRHKSNDPWSGLGALGERLDLRLSNRSLLCTGAGGYTLLGSSGSSTPDRTLPDLCRQGLHDELDLTFKDGLGLPVCGCLPFPSSIRRFQSKPSVTFAYTVEC